MIRLAESYELLQQPAQDVFAVRILALYTSYGTSFSFARFWIQESGDGVVTALISALDNQFTLSFSEQADQEELRSFFSVVGFQTLQCSGQFNYSAAFLSGCVLQKTNWFCTGCEKENVLLCPLDVVYQLNRKFLPDIDYRSWYTDLFRRVRQGAAKAFALQVNGTYVSAALYTSIYQDKKILGYIATDANWRKQGLASRLIAAVTPIDAGQYYLLCEKKNLAFYQQQGFAVIGKWRVYQNDATIKP